MSVPASSSTSASSTPLSRIPFSLESEKQIASLGGWLSIFAVIALVGMMGNLVGMIAFSDLSQLGGLLVNLLLAIWALQAASAFKSVARTDTADQVFLTEAFTKLRMIFLMQSLLIIMTLAIMFAALLIILLQTSINVAGAISPVAPQ